MYCEKLFAFEKKYKEKGYTIKKIYERRLKDEEPVIDAFLSWLDGLHPKSGDSITKAIIYTNGCRPYLKNYLKDGACSFSNNITENTLRPTVVSRKNWLFCDSQDGAQAGAVVFSIIETAKANGLDAKKYLKYLLDNRPNKKMTDEQLEALAPWNKNVRKTCVNDVE